MIDSLLMVAFGVLAVLVSYGRIAVSKDTQKNQEYLSKYGILLRVCGIILVASGLLLVMSNLFASS